VALIGREAESAELGALIERARAGRSGSLVVRGDAGIGKTALLDEAARAAEGMVVLRTVGVETESELAFAGLSQLLNPLLPHLDSLPAPQAAALRAALAIGPPVPSDPFAVSVGTLGLLAAAAGDEGLVAVVDDAHFLDTASLRALLFVAQRLRAEGIALLFAARTDMPIALEQSQIPVLLLEPLSDDASSAILDCAPNALAPGVAAAVRQTAAGNPLALVEIPKLLTAGTGGWSPAAPRPPPQRCWDPAAVPAADHTAFGGGAARAAPLSPPATRKRLERSPVGSTSMRSRRPRREGFSRSKAGSASAIP
jgi:AAA ATPase domain